MKKFGQKRIAFNKDRWDRWLARANGELDQKMQAKVAVRAAGIAELRQAFAQREPA